MKKIAAVLGLGLLSLAAGCFDGDSGGKSDYAGPLLRWHHAGRGALAQATNAATLKQIDMLPITDELRAQISSNLAKSTLKFWQKELPPGAADPTPLLQPLIYDCLTAETFVEVRGPIGRAESALAIELNDARAKLWSTNIWQLAALWKLGEPHGLTAEGFAGWELKRPDTPSLLQFFRAGKWVVIGLGNDKLALAPALLTEARQSQRPVPDLKGSLLEIHADLPGLRPWVPLLADFPLPPAQLTMAGRGENVRTEVRLKYPGKVPWTYEPWKIPTNLVSEPLSSFTVARGVSPWLSRVKGFKDLGINPLPNQFCAWAITNDICRIYFAVPVADATNTIKQLAPTVPRFAFDRFGSPLGNFLYVSNRAELLWGGLPYIAPFLKAARGPASEFVLGGIFFLAPRNYPPPPELYAQIGGRTNLLYYDWELTDHRLDHSKQLYELANIVSNRRLASTTTASRKWLSSIGPRLRDTVTEITQSGPQELLLVRKSGIGFTGFELATFSVWLDSPGFPHRIEPPPLLTTRTNSAARTNQAPRKVGP